MIRVVRGDRMVLSLSSLVHVQIAWLTVKKEVVVWDLRIYTVHIGSAVTDHACV